MLASEIELVKKVQAGDEQAFNDLYHTYYPRAMAIAYRFTNDYADAQDVVQETFFQVHKSIHSLNEPEYFYSWLNQIIHSKSVNLFYRNRNENAVDPSKIETVKIYEEKRRYMLPQEEANYISEKEVLKSIIAQMDEKYRVVIDLAYFRQMKLEEIARFLDLPLGTVKTRCRRAKADLKKRIAQFEETEKRKISFQADTLLPSVTVFSFTTIWKAIKQKGTAFFNGQAVNVVCMISAVGLVFSGGIMMIQDQHHKQDQLANTIEDHKYTDNEYDAEKVFGPFVYEGKTISTTREAYYVCINWAKSTNEMKQKSEDEIKDIHPIYQALKHSNDKYYHMLIDRGWEAAFLTLVEI